MPRSAGRFEIIKSNLNATDFELLVLFTKRATEYDAKTQYLRTSKMATTIV